MKIPDSRKYNPDPDYIRSLVEQIGLSQRKIAVALGINDSTFRRYISSPEKPSHTPIPYVVQYALEAWAGINKSTVEDKQP